MALSRYMEDQGRNWWAGKDVLEVHLALIALPALFDTKKDEMSGFLFQPVRPPPRVTISSAFFLCKLGAGLGLNSLTAEALGARTVTVTDGDAAVLRMASDGLRSNFPRASRNMRVGPRSYRIALVYVRSVRSTNFACVDQIKHLDRPAEPTGSLMFALCLLNLHHFLNLLLVRSPPPLLCHPRLPQALPLRMGDREGSARLLAEEALSSGRPAFDVIVASDLTYRREDWPAFVATVGELSDRRTVVLYGTTTRLAGEWEALQAQFRESGFAVEDVRLRPRAAAARPGSPAPPAVLTDDVRLMRLSALAPAPAAAASGGG